MSETMTEYQKLLQLLKTPLRKKRPIDDAAEREKYTKGEKARQLLEDETLMEAFAAVEDVYMNAWKLSAGADTALRERCFTAISILADIKGALNSYVRDGAVSFERLQTNLRP